MRKILAGRVYRHFKGKDYKVLVVAQHTETGEQCVVYQALYDDFAYYVRPYAMFASEVDREKYPEVEQQCRLQHVVLAVVHYSPSPARRSMCRAAVSSAVSHK